jgi:signal recognition particle GTPase
VRSYVQVPALPATISIKFCKNGAASLAVTKKSHALLGGFLGSGKTAAAACLTRYLADQGLRAGLITNDQGEALVYTAALQN